MNRSRKQLIDSRLELLKLMVRGVPLKQAATEIATKYPGTSIQSVQTDWQRRRKWLPDLVNVGDSTVFEQAFFGLKELIPMAWLEFSRAPAGTAVKNRALAMLVDVYCHLISILQDSGFAPKAPLQLETTTRQDLNDDDIWDELTEDEKRQLITASEIYSRHRNARRQGASASTFTADPDGKRALLKAAEAEKAALTNLRGMPVPESQTPVKVTKKPTEEEVKKEQNVNEK